jgi:hypothetical protein
MPIVVGFRPGIIVSVIKRWGSACNPPLKKVMAYESSEKENKQSGDHRGERR